MHIIQRKSLLFLLAFFCIKAGEIYPKKNTGGIIYESSDGITDGLISFSHVGDLLIQNVPFLKENAFVDYLAESGWISNDEYIKSATTMVSGALGITFF